MPAMAIVVARIAPAIVTVETVPGTAIVSQMDTGVEVVRGTIGEEMEAVLDRAKTLTQMKMETDAATRVIATEVEVPAVDVQTLVAITTAAVAAPALVRPAATATTSTAPATGPVTAVVEAMLARDATPGALRRRRPRSPKTIATSAPFSFNRSRSVRRLATFDSSSRPSAL
jgi:hypothetical protein